MLDWKKKNDVTADEPMRKPASAAKPVGELRATDPLTALQELSGWLEQVKGMPGHDERTRSEFLSQIQERSEAQLSALVAQLVGKPSEEPALPEASWKIVVQHLSALTGALISTARALLKDARANPSLQPHGATGAARCLHACRMLAKASLLRYVSLPPKLWRLAYQMHDAAEKAGCAVAPVPLHSSRTTTTSATQELLRLLMLQVAAPEMMSPAQIEVADRAAEQFGGYFLLRPRGVADRPFCFDASSELPPRRASGQTPGGEMRYFGAGNALDTLNEHLKSAMTTGESKAFGSDLAPHAQISAIQHLLAFWGTASPYSPPARSPASGELAVTHRFGQLWQQLSQARSELSLAEDGDGPAQAAETWTLRNTGGDELGAEIPQAAAGWAQCGDLVGVSLNGDQACWLGMIRALQAGWGRPTHASIAIISRDARALELRAVMETDEESAFSEAIARQFEYNRVRAIIVADGGAWQKPALLLASESWKKDRVYEATLDGATRRLRALQVLQRGDDYVRASFEWLAGN